MRVIITGGTGLIGSTLANSLAEKQYEVVVLSRNPDRAPNFPSGVKVVGWDGRTDEGWGHLTDGSYAIVNLAGESIGGTSYLNIRWTANRKRRIRESRLNAAKAVLAAVRSAKVKPEVFIQSSAVGYYGPRGPEIIDESAPAGSDFLANFCREWEASTQELESMAVRRVVIRSGVVLSRQDGALPKQMLPFQLFTGGPIASGKQGYPWIHLEDEVGAISFLMNHRDAHGAFNLTGPEMIDNDTFGRALAKAMGRPYWLPIPTFVFKLAFGEAATVLVDGQKPAPKRLLELGYEFKFKTAQAALNNLFRK